ncbi:hypothetical protein ACE6H2_027240 [Prunus campanulata]
MHLIYVHTFLSHVIWLCLIHFQKGFTCNWKWFLLVLGTSIECNNINTFYFFLDLEPEVINMAASSSAAAIPTPENYDVFLSFRGEDQPSLCCFMRKESQNLPFLKQLRHQSFK